MTTKFLNAGQISPEETGSLGVLLVNLGSPASPEVSDVRHYLSKFLSDNRVVELTPWLRFFLLHGLILRTRPPRSAREYISVWTKEGSPLDVISRRQATALQTALEQKLQGDVQVELAMRYGAPDIPSALRRLHEKRVQRILVLPAYPQYSATTIATVFDAITKELQTWRFIPEIRFIHGYYQVPGYTSLIANSIERFWAQHGQAERLLFSFHSIPKAYSDKGDPYYQQCQHTAHLIVDELGLESDQWDMSFQSRLGKAEWLRPYTDHKLVELAKKGVRELDVLAPCFAADCLETLKELSIDNQKLFLHAGGKSYRYIPCLNDAPDHIAFLAELVWTHCQGWPEAAKQ